MSMFTTAASDAEPSALDELERLRDILEPALAVEPVTHSFEDVHDRVSKGELQVWSTDRSILLTEILDAPNDRRAICAVWGAGDMDELKGLREDAEAFGRRCGCHEAWIRGRRGWERVYKDDGYRLGSVTLVKEL